MSATTFPFDLTGPTLNVGGRDWKCRPELSAGLADAAVRLGYRALATIKTNRQRRRVADSFYRKFLQKQVIGSYELLRMIGEHPELWPQAVDQACSLAEWYIVNDLVG